jgi:hypothetical protein
MAESAARLCTDEALHERMARSARADVEAHWRREPMVERYEAYYRTVLDFQG